MHSPMTGRPPTHTFSHHKTHWKGNVRVHLSRGACALADTCKQLEKNKKENWSRLTKTSPIMHKKIQKCAITQAAPAVRTLMWLRLCCRPSISVVARRPRSSVALMAENHLPKLVTTPKQQKGGRFGLLKNKAQLSEFLLQHTFIATHWLRERSVRRKGDKWNFEHKIINLECGILAGFFASYLKWSEVKLSHWLIKFCRFHTWRIWTQCVTAESCSLVLHVHHSQSSATSGAAALNWTGQQGCLSLCVAHTVWNIALIYNQFALGDSAELNTEEPKARE